MLVSLTGRIITTIPGVTIAVTITVAITVVVSVPV